MANFRWVISLTVQYNVRHPVLSLWQYPDPCITATSLDSACFNVLAYYALSVTVKQHFFLACTYFQPVSLKRDIFIFVQQGTFLKRGTFCSLIFASKTRGNSIFLSQTNQLSFLHCATKRPQLLPGVYHFTQEEWSCVANYLQRYKSPSPVFAHLVPPTRSQAHGRSLIYFATKTSHRPCLISCKTERFKRSFFPAMCLYAHGMHVIQELMRI